MKFKPTDKEGIFKSLFAAYFVLLLHIALVAGAGVTVVLFKGVYQYLPWIMGGIAAAVIALFWIFYLRIKRSSTDIKDVLSHPAFQNRNVEIKLLGGLASFKLSAPGGNMLQAGNLLPAGEGGNLLDHDTTSGRNQASGHGEYHEHGDGYHNHGGYHTPRLESGDTNIERRLSELAGLYKKNLIDDEEYHMAKKRILFETKSITDNLP
ncbi:MAG: SHOCT domain-containing protein [Desulfamplus sp.]|nr:SHOCT domain-containing protein [Desulfamplus sp.]